MGPGPLGGAGKSPRCQQRKSRVRPVGTQDTPDSARVFPGPVWVGYFVHFWDKDVKILRRAGPGLVRDMCVILEYPSSSSFRISWSCSLNSKMSVVSPGLSDSIESPVMKCFETAKIPLGPGIWGPGAGPAAQGPGLGPAARTPGPRPGRRGPGHHRDAYPFYLSAQIRSIKLRSGPRPWTAGRRLPTVTKLLMNNSSSM